VWWWDANTSNFDHDREVVLNKDALEMQQKMMDTSFDFNDFLKQSELVTKMGWVAGIAKMMPGIGNQLNPSKIREVEARLRSTRQ
jgi:signal recognition particle subunit SRP54